MLVALAVPLVAIAAGTLLAFAGGASPRVLLPVRSFALAAVLVALFTHLLPEAIAEGGPWVLVVFGAGVAAPLLISRAAAAGARAGHARLATELGFLGVVLHQVGDGLALGAVSDHWDVVIAIGVHTVPLAAVVALGMLDLHGRNGAIGRAAILVLATVAGVVATAVGGPLLMAGVAPWINAAVAGLLVHVLSHDLPTPARTGTAPLVEVIAIAAGVALPLVAGGDGDSAVLIDALREVVELVALPLAIGLAATIALELVAGPARDRMLVRARGPVGGIGAAAVAGTCSCRVAGPARGAVARAAPGAVIAFVLAAPELGLDTILVGAQVFGPEAVVIRIGAAIAIALVAGAIAGRIAIPRPPLDDHHDHDHAPDHAHEAPAPRRSLLSSIDEVIIHSGPWLAIGLVAAALALIAIPDGALAGSRWLAIGLAIVIAVPAYVCAPAATPLAAALVARGLPPGAAIAGLLFGAATNRAALSVIARAYGTGATLAVVSLAALIAGGAGVAIELTGAVAPTAPAMPFEGPVAMAAAALLGLAVVRGLWRYGLAAWLEPIHGSDHRHHQHADGAPCEAGCHDH